MAPAHQPFQPLSSVLLFCLEVAYVATARQPLPTAPTIVADRGKSLGIRAAASLALHAIYTKAISDLRQRGYWQTRNDTRSHREYEIKEASVPLLMHFSTFRGSKLSLFIVQPATSQPEVSSFSFSLLFFFIFTLKLAKCVHVHVASFAGPMMRVVRKRDDKAGRTSHVSNVVSNISRYAHARTYDVRVCLAWIV